MSTPRTEFPEYPDNTLPGGSWLRTMLTHFVKVASVVLMVSLTAFTVKACQVVDKGCTIIQALPRINNALPAPGDAVLPGQPPGECAATPCPEPKK
jgi:hypothetical protein